ncbi:MAG: hypothetical protein MUF83_01975 [Acidimicrobiales bacterium]|jgi:hypothetical protein|nr:hypothetical protein [Acidimicrobiales bacterium]
MELDALALREAAAQLVREAAHLLHGLPEVTALAGEETWTGQRAQDFVTDLTATHRDLAIGPLSVLDELLAAAARLETRAALIDLAPPG